MNPRLIKFGAGICEQCGADKEHLEYLLCDECNALKNPVRCAPGMHPSRAR